MKNKKDLYLVLLYVVPAAYGVLLALLSFFRHDIIAGNVTAVGLAGVVVFWPCFFATTHILGKYLLDVGDDSFVLVLSKFLGFKEYSSLFAFFAHACIMILTFGTVGTGVYWVLILWPWR